MKTKLLIFGITGDLGTRKLLPALAQIISTGEFDDLSIIGVSRRETTVDELLDSRIEAGLLRDRTTMFSMDLATADEYNRLRDYVTLTDNEQLLVYLAVPPTAVSQIIEFMGEAGLNTPNVKILFEKPFGVDLKSATEVTNHTAKYYNESQIYRIDHYLAKEMAQNIVAIRGKNALFSHMWNNQLIESIEVIASEQIGIEGRAHFYEQTGALRDVVQGHLLQLLALTLLNMPKDLDWDTLPQLRLDALEQLLPIDINNVVRGQYETYRQEAGNNNSNVETFVSLELRSGDSNWNGVPIKLTTGKSLDKKTTEIRIHLKKIEEAQSNCIVLRIQPDEGIDIRLFVKKPGYSQEFEEQNLGFNYPADVKLPDAYEQVIVDAISSRKSLFTSSEEVLQSWRVLQPIQEYWANSDESPIIYKIGTPGPTSVK